MPVFPSPRPKYPGTIYGQMIYMIHGDSLPSFRTWGPVSLAFFSLHPAILAFVRTCTLYVVLSLAFSQQTERSRILFRHCRVADKDPLRPR